MQNQHRINHQTDIAKKYNISKSSVTLIKQKNDI